MLTTVKTTTPCNNCVKEDVCSFAKVFKEALKTVMPNNDVELSARCKHFVQTKIERVTTLEEDLEC